MNVLYDEAGNEYPIDDAGQLYVPLNFEQTVADGKIEEEKVRSTVGAAGYDLAAAESAVVPAHSQCLVKTGLAIAIPPDCYGRVAPRSGLALKKFIDVGAGVIDSDYRGELGVVLFNFGKENVIVHMGDRIAQLIFEK